VSRNENQAVLYFGNSNVFPRLLEPVAVAVHLQDVDVVGQPVVPNGIPLSKIHHAAFDAHLIGIDPDYRIYVSGRLLSQTDGPMLDALKRLHHGMLPPPNRPQDRPDRERLAIRFDRYKATA
jgi:putative restriction endonuclease